MGDLPAHILLLPPCPHYHSPSSPSPLSKNICLETSPPIRPTRTTQNIIISISFAKFITGRQAMHRLILSYVESSCPSCLHYLRLLYSLCYLCCVCCLCRLGYLCCHHYHLRIHLENPEEKRKKR